METQTTNSISDRKFVLNQLVLNESVPSVARTTDDFKNHFQQFRPAWLDDLLTKLTTPTGKKSFLVSKGNKYVNVPTENIALFYVKHESTQIMCFDKLGYYVNYSLEQIQSLLPEKQFYRINRQCLINFNAVKEVEHYFSRKLLVNTMIPTDDKLIVSRDKVSEFLHWLDNR